MKKTFMNYIFGAVGGLFLYFISMIQDIFYKIDIPFEWFFALYYGSFIIAICGAVISVIYNKPTTIQAIIRVSITVCSYIALLIINAYLGTALFLERILGLASGSGANNASCLMFVIFTFCIFISLAITLIVLIIKNAVTKKSPRQ